MANNPGMSTNFKQEILIAGHNLTTATGHTLRMALFLSSGSINPGVAAYSGPAMSGELVSANYPNATSNNVTNGATPNTSGTSAIWTPTAAMNWTSIVYSNLDCSWLYNSSVSNKGIAVFTFAAQSSAGGNFTLTMPPHAVGTALLQIT